MSSRNLLTLRCDVLDTYPVTLSEALDNEMEVLFMSMASTVEAVVAPVPTDPVPAPGLLDSIGDL